MAFGKTGETIGEHVRKDSKLYIEGKLQNRQWKDQQGVDRYTTEIVIGEVQMLDSR